MSEKPTPAVPDVSVIVVNYRSADLVLRALDAVANSAGRSEVRLEEIIVDNASDADEVTRLRHARPGATILALDANRGFAAGNNAGIAQARGRWLLLVNPDAFASDDAVPELVAYGDSHPEVGVVAPQLRNIDGSIQDSAFRRLPGADTVFVDFCAPLARLIRGSRLDSHSVPRRQLTTPQRIVHATGAALLVRRSVVSQAGPMDERFFMYLEETEWQRRIARTGAEIHIVPSVSFVHLGGGSSAGSPLASPAYLDSLVLFHRRPALTVLAIRAAGLLSLISLRLATALRPRSETLRDALATFTRLRLELAGRDRRGRRRQSRPAHFA